MRAASDAAFICPTRTLARTLASDSGAKVWSYSFTVQPKFSLNEDMINISGSFHGAEVRRHTSHCFDTHSLTRQVPFVFGFPAELSSAALHRGRP